MFEEGVAPQRDLVDEPTAELVAADPAGDAGAAALAAAKLPLLRELHLAGNEITDDGAAALAGSPLLGRLRWLGLRDNALTPGADVILRDSPYWHWRTVIETEDNRPPWAGRGDPPIPLEPGDDEA